MLIWIAISRYDSGEGVHMQMRYPIIGMNGGEGMP